MIYGVNLFQLKNGYKQTNLTKIEKKIHSGHCHCRLLIAII